MLGVLRWQIELDRRIRTFLKHPNAKLDAEVLIALRLGAFQLLHMDRIPAHAAIDESVELTKQAGHRFASGMVNAVLRKVRSIGRPQTQRLKTAGADFPVDGRALDGYYGVEAARGICRHGQSNRSSRCAVDSPEH